LIMSIFALCVLQQQQYILGFDAKRNKTMSTYSNT